MPWVAPTGVILPPLRGSDINIVFTVGFVCVAHFTHGWVPAIATRFMWVAPTVVILPPLRGSDINIVFTVGFAAPKALASPTSKFLSPLRGCSRALTGAIFCCIFQGLRSLRSLTRGYEWSHPAGGVATRL